jgi:acetyl esterase/lipase
MLILHGEEDTNVPVSQAEAFHRALRRFGVEHEYVRYPRESHAIGERNHQLDLLRRTRAWFARWLTPAPAESHPSRHGVPPAGARVPPSRRPVPPARPMRGT